MLDYHKFICPLSTLTQAKNLFIVGDPLRVSKMNSKAHNLSTEQCTKILSTDHGLPWSGDQLRDGFGGHP